MNRDLVYAALVGIAAFAVYLRTLAPGLVALLDTPMFQFIGRVLGVAHNPGYPLYVLLTFPFSYLPVGSLAYRINLFSATCASIAVALVFLAARQLGVRASLSAAAALALAFGQTFWSQAVIAEVYMLNAALVAGVLLATLAWRRTARPGLFYLAVALLALGLGNHTTITAFAPGICACALVADRRFATRARTIAIAAGLVAVGLLQYAFIILRTRQGAYVESPASNVAELLRVMRGAQFSNRLFVFDLNQIIFDRIHLVAAQILAAEMTWPALLLSAAGIVLLLRRRLADGLLLGLGAAAILTFAVNYSVVDLAVFVLPAVLVLCIAAAFAAESAAAALSRRVAWAGPVVAAAALIVPAMLVSGNFATNDLSRNTGPSTYFEGLFAGLPAKSVVVHEDFLTDRMVTLYLIGERAPRGRDIVHVPQNPARLRGFIADGYSVLAFQEATRRLRYQGMAVDFTQPRFVEGALAEYLSNLPDGSVVGIAVPAVHAAAFEQSGSAQLRSIGGPSGLGGRTQSNLIIVGVRGASSGAIFRASVHSLRVDVASGEPIGTTGWKPRTGFSLESDALRAVISFGEREAVRTAEGAAVAVWNRDGGLERVFVLQAVDRFRMPVQTGWLTARSVRGMAQSVPINTAGSDLTALAASGSMIFGLPPGTSLIADVRGDRPLAPRVVEPRWGPVTVDITPQDDGYRIDASAARDAPSSTAVEVAFGGVPGHVVARRDGTAAGPDPVAFAVPLTGLLQMPDRSSEVLLMGRDDQSRLPGAGWSSVDADAFGPFRWITDSEAHLLLPVGGENRRSIAIQAFSSEATPSTARIGLELNGTRLPVRPLASGWHRYEWPISSGVLRPGLNTAIVQVDRGAQVAAASVVLTHQGE